MARKKKVEKFSVVKAVKSAAREQVGTVPPTRAVPDLKQKAMRRSEKHKKTLGDMLQQDGE